MKAMKDDVVWGFGGTAVVGGGLGAIGLGGLTDGLGAPLGCVGGATTAVVGAVPFITYGTAMRGTYIALKPFVINAYNDMRHGCGSE
jgi:hypothetical protein